MALPILLMIAALMIGLGSRWCWKIRGYSMARHAAWSSRVPRDPSLNPRPDYWPQDAHASAGPADDAPELDFMAAYAPVVRSPGLPGMAIPEERLDPASGIIEGTAEVTVNQPMLRSMGKMQATAHVWLVDDQWQYAEMGLGSAQQRRIPVLYELARASGDWADAFLQTAKYLLRAPFREDLRPLGAEVEYAPRHPPDFHPGLRAFSSLDPEEANDRVRDLIDRIKGKIEIDDEGEVRRNSSVPERMAGAYINLYEEKISLLMGIPNQQAQIAELQRRIALLEQFQTYLQTAYVP